MGKKKFIATALDPKYKAFVVHVTIFNIDSGDEMDPLKKAQIAHLKVNKALPRFLTSMLSLPIFFCQNWLQSALSIQESTIMPSN